MAIRRKLGIVKSVSQYWNDENRPDDADYLPVAEAAKGKAQMAILWLHPNDLTLIQRAKLPHIEVLFKTDKEFKLLTQQTSPE